MKRFTDGYEKEDTELYKICNEATSEKYSFKIFKMHYSDDISREKINTNINILHGN